MGRPKTGGRVRPGACGVGGPGPGGRVRPGRALPGAGRRTTVSAGTVARRTPAATANQAARYQTWVVALEHLTTWPTISGRSNTDWMAIRPGPCKTSHTDLACHRAELNQ
jgi:hypothetical protein